MVNIFRLAFEIAMAQSMMCDKQYFPLNHMFLYIFWPILAKSSMTIQCNNTFITSLTCTGLILIFMAVILTLS